MEEGCEREVGKVVDTLISEEGRGEWWGSEER
jgi:hypothetical protein